MQLVGAKVVDIQHTEQKASSLIYSSTEKDIPKVEEKKSKVTIKILAKKHNRTVIVTLVFLDSKLEGYAIYRTENNLQTAPESCDNLFSYCQRTNSTKYFLFKSIHQQLSTK
ncbi:hypothetical protein NEFER01_1965 [Nematocida sp. LUAm1]|nr:hypothetical protein NEFER01_1965 [Nematocida sp. LUAm1]